MHIQFVENIKQKVGDYVFKRDLKHNDRKREVHNLHTAKSIGILYDATDLKDMMLVSEFANDLFKTKKDVKALGFVNRNELTHHHMPMLKFDFFFLKDLHERLRLFLESIVIIQTQRHGANLSCQVV